MREQLIQYVELLFAGAKDCADIKQEILQNTLDRYDDLIAAGKVPEAAYRLAIAGIGDINEILGTPAQAVPMKAHMVADTEEQDTPRKKMMRAIAVGLYIIAIIPLIVMDGHILGFCGTLAIVAVATVLIMLGAKKDPNERKETESDNTPKSEIVKSVSHVIWATGLGVYFLLSFPTGAWHITWTIFPVLVALDSLITAIIRNQEALHSDVMFPNKQKVRKSIKNLIWAVGIAVYFIFGFATGAWYFIWLLLPITGAVQGLTMAIMDLMEVMEHET